jgi:hypothetical protein
MEGDRVRERERERRETERERQRERERERESFIRNYYSWSRECKRAQPSTPKLPHL